MVGHHLADQHFDQLNRRQVMFSIIPQCGRLAACLILTFTVTARAEQPGLLDKIIEAHKRRSSTYDSGHYLWKLNEVIDGKTHERRYEYWARKGAYLRFDEELLIDKEASGPIKSLILRPEGFFRLLDKGSQDSEVVTDFGPVDEGLPKIRQQFILEQENKIAADTFGNWIRKSREPGSSTTDLNLEEQPDDSLKISFSDDLPQGTRRIEGLLSSKDFRVLSWRYQFKGAEGSEFAGQFTEQVTEIVYDERAKYVPVKLLESIHTQDGNSTMRCELVEYDFMPASIDVFRIPGNAFAGSSSKSPVWLRRLSILSIGIALIASYLWLRKKH